MAIPLTRKNRFLTRLFERYEEAHLPYCVSRNAEETFSDSDSDVDLVVTPGDLQKAADLCIESAEANGYQLALQARFANLCLLFWAAPADFVRVDLDYCMRWRFFPVISASSILEKRRHEGVQSVPSPLGESLVVATSIAWKGKLTKRYRERLVKLSAEAAIENELVALASSGKVSELRRRIISRTLRSPSLWLEAVGAVVLDAKRIFLRFISPPGYYLNYSGGSDLEWKEVARSLSLALPDSKAYMFTEGPRINRVLLSLVRGGLVTGKRLFDSGIPRPPLKLRLRRLSRRGNRIEAYRPGDGRIYFVHNDSGTMLDAPAENSERQLVNFLGGVMARNHRKVKPYERGKFIVLVGLDGAGKTTFARNMCRELGKSDAVRRVRYQHWIPSLFKREYPWPSFVETPRKPPGKGLLSSILSAVRLLKNLAGAAIAYNLGVRRWVKRGEMVIVDRFIYNYWLDPVSLRYSGPSWLLAFTSRVMPKPDILFSLETDADTLLSRKQELTREEIAHQSVKLRELPLAGVRRVVVDASLPPLEMVEFACDQLEMPGDTKYSESSEALKKI